MAGSNLFANDGYDSYFPMMSDRIRVEAYRKAIFSSVQPGDVVLDLGAGLGLLSFFALQAGASKIYAIEGRRSALFAEEIAKENGFSEQIELIAQNSLEVEIPQKADILITETMGSFGIDENMIGFINDARRRLLKPGGRVLPEGITCHLACTSNREFFDKNNFWMNIKGLNFSPALEELWAEPLVTSIAENELVSPPIEFACLDLNAENPTRFEKRMQFEIAQETELTGIAGWFHVQLTSQHSIETSPDSPLTHWKQVFFPLDEPCLVRKGDCFLVDFIVEPSPEVFDQCEFSYRCTKI